MQYRLLYDNAGAAEMLATTPQRIDELRRSGVLAAVEQEGKPCYRYDDLRAYAAALPPWTRDDEEAEAAKSRAAQEAEAAATLAADEERRQMEEVYRFREVNPETYLNRKQAAQRLGRTPQTLLAWAKKGDGPEFVTLGVGGRISRYPLSKLETWERTHRQDEAR